jgi:hypothetical protein
MFLEPLLEELKQLWSIGRWTRDAANFNGEPFFKLRSILLWIIHDFLGHGLVAGCVTKGY